MPFPDSGHAMRIAGDIENGVEPPASEDRTHTRTATSPGAIGTILEGILGDLGFETASLYVGGGGGWKLLHRAGPARAWHSVLDPSALEGTPEAAEYDDARTIPGVGPRLATLGCASVASLPLPEGGRLLLDSAANPGQPGWIERARPYLTLLALMTGPEWSRAGALRTHEEVATLQRVFTTCQDVLGRNGATVEGLLGAVREALSARELFLIVERAADMEVFSSPEESWPRRLPRDVQEEIGAASEGEIDGELLQRVAVSLGVSSRALAGSFGRDHLDLELVVAGWSEGPALSSVSMGVVARAVSTARAGLQIRRRAIDTQLDRERTRMAYALHDGLTQSVAGAVLELEALHRRVERDPAEALRSLERSKTEIRKSLAELRSMLFDLSQSAEERKPAEPLTRYIEDVVKRWRLPARVAVEGDLTDVPARVLSVAYVVIREALANAAKHSAGSNVTVSIATNEQDLMVIVGDGGQGFTRHDEEAARAANHIGLDMLRRRVVEVGGKLQVESRPGAGTRVVAQLPLRDMAS